MGPPPPVTLRVLFGTLNVSGNINVLNGGQFVSPISSVINVNEINIAAGGQLRGGHFINPIDPNNPSLVVNSGLVGPGINGAGITNIDGDYQQLASGELEMQVGGVTMPGILHDQLQVTGNAALDGKLVVPIASFGGPPLAPGTQVTLLQGSTVTGEFSGIVSPNLADQMPPLAARVTYPGTSAVLEFVSPVPNSFDDSDPNSTVSNWSSAATWNGDVPDSTNTTTITNTQLTPRTIELPLGPATPESAFVHELNLSGTAAPMTLRINSGSTFSSTSGVTLGNNGVLELNDGLLTTTTVQVDDGGLVAGSGTIRGNVILGAPSGTGSATLSPGFSGGEVTVEENLTINSEGTLEIELFDPNDFDQVLVGESANLGGTLVIDVSGATGSLSNTTFEVLTTENGAVNMTFEAVQTVGGSGTFFAPTYAPESVTLQEFTVGDMNRDSTIDANDPEAFALAITSPDDYYTTYGISGDDSGNVDGMGGLDFDDIDDFASLPGIPLSGLEMLQLIEEFTVPEPSSALLGCLAGSILVAVSRRAGFRSRACASWAVK